MLPIKFANIILYFYNKNKNIIMEGGKEVLGG